jgi:hypothetical protein
VPEAKAIIDRRKEQLATALDMLWSPTIRLASVAPIAIESRRR